MSSKRVGIIIDTFLPLIGGAEMHAYQLAKFLFPFHPVKIFTNTAGELNIEGNIPVQRCVHGRFFILSFFKDVWYIVKFILSVDIVHAHYTYYLSSLSVILGKIFFRPVVVTLHGLGTLDSSVKGSFLRKFFRYTTFKFSSAVIATSDEMAEVAKKFISKEKIFVIPNGVDTVFFSPPQAPTLLQDKIIVLSVRRLNPKNGVQYLVEAMPEILAQIKNIEFWIACEGRLENYLKTRAFELGVNGSIKFLGDIPNEDLLRFYADAQIVVFPSSAESTSIACLEAMSMEKIVVASALQVYQQLLGTDRGVLVRLFDREYSDYHAPLQLPVEKKHALAQSIISIIQDGERVKFFGKNARQYVQHNFDWRVLIPRIEKVYTYASSL